MPRTSTQPTRKYFSLMFKLEQLVEKIYAEQGSNMLVSADEIQKLEHLVIYFFVNSTHRNNITERSSIKGFWSLNKGRRRRQSK